MTILGIDPGLERVGYAVIERNGSQLKAIAYGLIQTPRIDLPDRVRLIYEEILQIIDKHEPEAIATERLLFTVNKTTGLDVAKALGVILLATSVRGLPWTEYSPPEVKQSIVGNGNAEKKQIQFMVQRILGLAESPKPDDVADAIAVAITHAFRSRVNLQSPGRNMPK